MRKIFLGSIITFTFLYFTIASNAQNVGIGITTPQAKLDVNGSLLLRGKNTNAFTDSIRAGVEFFLGRRADNSLSSGQLKSDLAFNFGGDGGGFRHFIATRHSNLENSNLNAIDFYINSSFLVNGSSAPGIGNINALSITANGIGLFAPNPKAELQFSNNLFNRKLVLWDGGGSDNKYYGFGVNPDILRYQVPISTANHVFYSGINDATSLELMRITGTGNVGIGNSNPNAPLQFSNNLVNRKIVLWDIYGNNNRYLGFGVNANALRYQIGAVTDSHVFYAGITDSTSLELMRITGTGNVGIGNSNPTNKLDVNGNVGVTGVVNMGYIYNFSTYTLSGHHYNEYVLQCPSGTKLLTGGGGHRDFNDAAQDIILNYNGPDPNAPTTAWRIILNNIGSSDRTVQIYCTCARIN